MSNKGILFLLICLVLLPSAVYAHGMFLELEEPGVLRVDMMDNSRRRTNATECILCMRCVEECPQNALYL